MEYGAEVEIAKVVERYSSGARGRFVQGFAGL